MTHIVLLVFMYLILHDALVETYSEQPACSPCLFQGYQFEEDNPYLSHPDPLSEGVKRMEAGDIPGAVRFFESAVQREPDNQLVRLFQPVVLSACFQFFQHSLNNKLKTAPENSALLQFYCMFASQQKAVVMML